MAVHTRSRYNHGMGLLDKLQPKKPQPKPSDLAFDSEGNLLVRWDDGRESKFPPRWLRANCPCAGCVEEWSGRRTVGEAQVKDGVRAQSMNEVGRYAMQIQWSDGHSTGIYSWDYLLKLRDEQPVDSAR
jgi:DUF971 family protein